MELSDVNKHKTYTTKEVADFMGVSTITVLHYIKKGQLDAVSISKPGSKGKGKKYRMTAKNVQDFYDRRAGFKRSESIAKAAVKERVEAFSSGVSPNRQDK